MKRSFRLQQPAGFLGFDNSLLAIKYSFHSILWFCGCSTWTNYESVARLEGISIYLYIYATLMEMNRVTQREHSRIYLHLCIWIYDLITPAQVSPFVHLSATHLLMAFVYSNLRKGQLDPIRIDWCNVCYCYMYIYPPRLRIAHCLLFKLRSSTWEPTNCRVSITPPQFLNVAPNCRTDSSSAPLSIGSGTAFLVSNLNALSGSGRKLKYRPFSNRNETETSTWAS